MLQNHTLDGRIYYEIQLAIQKQYSFLYIYMYIEREGVNYTTIIDFLGCLLPALFS